MVRMAYGQPTRRDRATSVAAVALVHAALALILLRGWTVPLAPLPPREPTVLLDIAPAPPEPPAQPPPAEARADAPRPKDPEGAASPADLRNTPVPVAAPEPIVQLPPPPPIDTAPVPATGTRTEAGASDVPGPGTGAGGVGDGRGSGLSGDGTGGGGGGGRARPAAYRSGVIDDRDWPRGLDVPGFEGATIMRLTISTGGRVIACGIARSSGLASLDRLGCRLAMRRFRYRPALDGNGQATRSVETARQEWAQDARPADIWVEPTIPDDE